MFHPFVTHPVHEFVLMPTAKYFVKILNFLNVLWGNLTDRFQSLIVIDEFRRVRGEEKVFETK